MTCRVYRLLTTFLDVSPYKDETRTRCLVESSDSGNAEKAKGLWLFRRQQIQTKDAAKLPVTAYATKSYLLVLCRQAGLQLQHGGRQGGRAGVQLLPVTWREPTRHLLGMAQKRGGREGGRGVRRSTAAVGKQRGRVREGERQATRQGALCWVPGEDKNMGRVEGDEVDGGCAELGKDACAVLQQS